MIFIHYLAEVTRENDDLHIYISNEKFNSDENIVCVSYDEKETAYFLSKDTNKNGVNWFMGLIGKDTQNWSYKNIVIHFGNNVWKFYNERNVDIFTNEAKKYFNIKDYDFKD